jgi:hypothetical protein
LKNSKGVPPQPSSRQHKDNIQELKSEDALEALQGLNPVTFTYNEEALSKGVPPPDACSKHFKDNINYLNKEDAVKAVTALNPVTFTYKECPQEQRVGFIAEDVPHLVATNDRKGLYAMDIVAVLTKVVQAQQKTITDMRDELNELKAKVM